MSFLLPLPLHFSKIPGPLIGSLLDAARFDVGGGGGVGGGREKNDLIDS